MNKNRVTGREGAEALEDDVLVVEHEAGLASRARALAGSGALGLLALAAAAGLYHVGHYADAFVVAGGWYVLSRVLR